MIPHALLEMTTDVASADIQLLVPFCVRVSLVLPAFCGKFNTSINHLLGNEKYICVRLPIDPPPQHSASKGQTLSLRACGNQMVLRHVSHAGSPQGHIFTLTLRITEQG
jgi:hypothetical protein